MCGSGASRGQLLAIVQDWAANSLQANSSQYGWICGVTCYVWFSVAHTKWLPNKYFIFAPIKITYSERTPRTHTLLHHTSHTCQRLCVAALFMIAASAKCVRPRITSVGFRQTRILLAGDPKPKPKPLRGNMYHKWNTVASYDQNRRIIVSHKRGDRGKGSVVICVKGLSSSPCHISGCYAQHISRNDLLMLVLDARGGDFTRALEVRWFEVRWKIWWLCRFGVGTWE